MELNMALPKSERPIEKPVLLLVVTRCGSHTNVRDRRSPIMIEYELLLYIFIESRTCGITGPRITMPQQYNCFMLGAPI